MVYLSYIKAISVPHCSSDRLVPSRLTAAAVSSSQLIQTRRLWFFGHVARMDTSLDITRALKVAIRGLPRFGGVLPVSPWRPRHRPTWLRTLDADLQPHILGLNSSWK